MRSTAASRKEAAARRREELYPDAVHFPHALSLAEYAGTYSSPGYGNITFGVSDEVAGGRLSARVDDRVWSHQIEMEHVAGEHFVAWANATANTPSAFFLGIGMRAMFRVDAHRVPTELGLQYETKMGDELIWFRRVE